MATARAYALPDVSRTAPVRPKQPSSHCPDLESPRIALCLPSLEAGGAERVMLSLARVLTLVSVVALLAACLSPVGPTTTTNVNVSTIVPVFPGAEGYGTTTPAGRGGRVIQVTNLNDAGPGSFRAAVQTAGRRTVIFDVSGTITLTSDVFISNAVNANDPGDGTKDFLTVAGQTAPSPGITIRGAGLVIRASDVLIQHLRIRPGVLGTGNHDAITITGRRIVVDHVSTSWAGNGGKNIDIYN